MGTGRHPRGSGRDSSSISGELTLLSHSPEASFYRGLAYPADHPPRCPQAIGHLQDEGPVLREQLPSMFLVASILRCGVRRHRPPGRRRVALRSGGSRPAGHLARLPFASQGNPAGGVAASPAARTNFHRAKRLNIQERMRVGARKIPREPVSRKRPELNTLGWLERMQERPHNVLIRSSLVTEGPAANFTRSTFCRAGPLHPAAGRFHPAAVGITRQPRGTGGRSPARPRARPPVRPGLGEENSTLDSTRNMSLTSHHLAVNTY
jgi:hypothetical protein